MVLFKLISHNFLIMTKHSNYMASRKDGLTSKGASSFVSNFTLFIYINDIVYETNYPCLDIILHVGLMIFSKTEL